MISNFYSLLSTVFSFVIVLCPLIIFHELGHYWVARWRKVQVESFSIGFGPALFQWKDKHGTMWKFCPYLFGGYVKFLGDADPSGFTTTNTHSKHSIIHKKPWEKIIIALAGPVANYVLAFVLVLVLVKFFGLPNAERPVIGVVVETSRAEGKLLPKDEIIQIQNKTVNSFTEVLQVLRDTPLSEDLHILVRRDAQEVVVDVLAPKNADSYKMWQGNLGIAPQYKWKMLPPDQYMSGAVNFFLNESVKPLSIFSSSNITQLSGPLGIAKQARDVLAEKDIKKILWTMISISIALGFFNLLPIPLLDGGNVLLSSAEWILGRPFSHRVTQGLLWISISILGTVFVISSFQDLRKFAFIQEAVVYLKNMIS